LLLEDELGVPILPCIGAKDEAIAAVKDEFIPDAKGIAVAENPFEPSGAEYPIGVSDWFGVLWN
jgi:hypothetical protein